MRVLPPLAMVLTAALTSACNDTTFVARFNGGGLRAVVCKGDDDICKAALRPPVARAGAGFSVLAGTLVGLDGSASSDPDGHITAFAWVQVNGPLVVLDGADSATPSFQAPAVAETTSLTFRLTVTDNDDQTASDEVDVTVEQASGQFVAAQGLAWLQARLAPGNDALLRDPDNNETIMATSTGILLAATTTGRYQGLDDTHIETHLAHLRGLATNLEQATASSPLTTPAEPAACTNGEPIDGTAVLAAGLVQTAALLETLDPSLAERYLGISASIDVGPDWTTLERLYQGTAKLEGVCESAFATGIDADVALHEAISTLLDLTSGGDADATAVGTATLRLLGALDRDAQPSSSPTSTQIPLSQRSTDSPLLTSAPSR